MAKKKLGKQSKQSSQRSVDKNPPKKKPPT